MIARYITKLMAEEYEKLNDLKSALRHYTDASERATQERDKVSFIARAADINMQLGEFPAARECLLQILQIDIIYYRADQTQYIDVIVATHMCKLDFIAGRKLESKYSLSCSDGD